MVNFKFVLFGQSVQLLPIAVNAAVTSRGVPRPNLLLVRLKYIFTVWWTSGGVPRLKLFISMVNKYLLIGGPPVEFLAPIFFFFISNVTNIANFFVIEA